jgi:hypothetical protein
MKQLTGKKKRVQGADSEKVDWALAIGFDTHT